MATDFTTIPIIDVSPLVTKSSDDGANMLKDVGVCQVVTQLDQACRQAGFFYVLYLLLLFDDASGFCSTHLLFVGFSNYSFSSTHLQPAESHLHQPSTHCVLYAMTEVSNDRTGPRRWTDEEDTLLVDLLMSLHVEGKWKAEGGFKSGYLVHLEKLIFEKMPEAKLKSSNIESRLGYLKRRFNALLDIKHKASGFGWDDSLKMVTGDRKLYNGWCESHKDAKGLYRKSFPLFDAMEEIYARDRATGTKSNMPLDRDDQEDDQEVMKEVSEDGEQDVQLGDVSTEGSETSKRSGESSSKQPSKKKLRKNKEIQNMQKSFETLMGTMIEQSNAQISQLAAMLEGPKNYKVGLREELGKVQGISRSSILTLLMDMTENDVAIFRDLTDEDEKYDFLAMVMSRK